MGWSYSASPPLDMNAEGKSGIFKSMVILRILDATGIALVERQDVGIGIVAVPRDGTAPKKEAYETAIKGAVSDGLKRAARTLGPQFGNDLYIKAAR